MNVWMQHERFLSYLVIRAFTRTKTVRFYLRVIKVCRVQRWRFSKVLLPRLFVSNTNERARHSPESHLRISFDITARHKHNNIIRLQTFRLVYIELASSFFYCYLWSFFFLCSREIIYLNEILLLFSGRCASVGSPLAMQIRGAWDAHTLQVNRCVWSWPNSKAVKFSIKVDKKTSMYIYEKIY